MKYTYKLLLLLLISLQVVAAPNGQSLYLEHCAACHGDDGKGGVGVPLSLPSFLDRVPDEYLEKTIRQGRTGRVMPAFSDLSDAQLKAMVAYIRSWSVKPAPLYVSNKINGNNKAGKELYSQHCASCHGEDASGGKGTGVTFSRERSLPIIAPSLSNAGFLDSASDHMIKDTIKNGRQGTPMNSFREAGLSDQQIDDIVSYIRSLEKKPAKTKEQSLRANLVYESDMSLKNTLETVKKAIVGANFRIIRIQHFEQGYVKKGKEDEKKIIVYFCNFNMLNEALAIDPRVGLFLPCRITLIEQEGKVKLVSINPATLSKKFNNDELLKLCDEMTSLYESIMEEATL